MIFPSGFRLITVSLAGLRVEYDLNQAPGRRVRSLQIRCRDCPDNCTEPYKPVKSYKTYVIGMPSFLMHGGDGYKKFEEHDIYDFGKCTLKHYHRQKHNYLNLSVISSTVGGMMIS